MNIVRCLANVCNLCRHFALSDLSSLLGSSGYESYRTIHSLIDSLDYELLSILVECGIDVNAPMVCCVLGVIVCSFFRSLWSVTSMAVVRDEMLCIRFIKA
jgi:hypothetical protein